MQSNLGPEGYVGYKQPTARMADLGNQRAEKHGPVLGTVSQKAVSESPGLFSLDKAQLTGVISSLFLGGQHSPVEQSTT